MGRHSPEHPGAGRSLATCRGPRGHWRSRGLCPSQQGEAVVPVCPGWEGLPGLLGAFPEVTAELSSPEASPWGHKDTSFLEEPCPPHGGPGHLQRDSTACPRPQCAKGLQAVPTTTQSAVGKRAGMAGHLASAPPTGRAAWRQAGDWPGGSVVLMEQPAAVALGAQVTTKALQLCGVWDLVDSPP